MTPDPHGNQPVLAAGRKLPEAAAAVILVHGRGASAEDILSLAREFDRPELAYLAPQAAGNSWYPYSFLAPIQVGQLALIHGRITSVDKSSMEIRVDVESEDLLSGERRHTSTAYVTFVAIDPVTSRPAPVPPLILETDDEKAEHARALERRRQRLARRAESTTAGR